MMSIDDLRLHNKARARYIASATQIAGGRVDERVAHVVHAYDFDHAVDVTKEVVVVSIVTNPQG